MPTQNPLNIPLVPGNPYDVGNPPATRVPIVGYFGVLDTSGTCGVTMFSQIQQATNLVIDKVNHNLAYIPAVVPDKPFVIEPISIVPGIYA